MSSVNIRVTPPENIKISIGSSSRINTSVSPACFPGYFVQYNEFIASGQYLSQLIASHTGNERWVSTEIPFGYNEHFISWSPDFASIPTVALVSVQTTGNITYAATIKSKTISGCLVAITEEVLESGLWINLYSKL